jgi:hypothetical protein
MITAQNESRQSVRTTASRKREWMGIEPTKRRYDVPPVLKTGAVTRAAFTPELNRKHSVPVVQTPSVDRALPDSVDELIFILRPHSAQINQRATFLHSGEHGRTA